MTSQAEQSTAPRLEVRHLSKTFSGVTVLRDAGLVIAPGEVHALVGQNGSGKSTLIKLISGVYRADPGGDVLVDGHRIGTPVNAGRLHDEGLAFVHQDLGLVPHLTVRENVRVGQRSAHRITRWIDRRADARAVRETLDFLGTPIDTETLVARLAPSQKVAVAVARALQERPQGSGVIVFDESSRAIPRESIEDFYATIRLLADQGTAVLIVSHDLKEVLRLSDRVTVLRNGRVVAAGAETRTLDEAALTRLMLGRDGGLTNFVETMPARVGSGTVELRAVRGGRVRDLNATIGRGEVVGFTGTVDSGIPDLAPVLGGAREGSGEIQVGETTIDLERHAVAQLIAAGVAYIPQDRHADGLALDLTIEENVTLPHLPRRTRPEGRGWRLRETREALTRFDVRPSDPGAVVATLSGGNQQKVLMGKWLLGRPSLLILDEPTQAVDVGARVAVLEAARQAAVAGAAVVLCSSEIEDLEAVCDRVLVLERGRVARELERPFTPDDILDAMLTDPEGTHE